MKEKKFLFIKVKLDKLDSFAKFYYSDEMFWKKLRNKLFSHYIKDIKETISIHRDGSCQVNKKTTVIVWK